MFGQFVVCLDYMLSGVPVRHSNPESGADTVKTSGRRLQAGRKLGRVGLNAAPQQERHTPEYEPGQHLTA